MKGERDVQLITAAVKGSEEAFRGLMQRYHSVVYSVVRGVLGARDDVEDVVQETFIKVYRGLPRFRGDSSFATWIYRIARNEAINAARRREITGQPVEDMAIESPASERPDEQYRRTDDRRLLERYLAELDESYRVSLELRYMGDKSYAEISEIMDIPVGTVKTNIHRAKAELKRIMTRDLGDERKYS